MKLNVKNKPDYLSRRDITLNHEGEISYLWSDKIELFKQVATCFFGEPKFYTNSKTSAENLIQIAIKVAKEDPDFVLRLAIKARHEYNLRTVPIVLLNIVVNTTIHPNTYKAVAMTISRADELTEIVAAAQLFSRKDGKNKLILPQAIKKGVALAFNKFDSYQFAKYDRKNYEITFSNLLDLTHPKPKNNEQSTIFKSIRDRSLASPNTWEVIISVKGSTRENWEKALEQMPIFAFLRNLRNLMKNGVNFEDKLVGIFHNEEIIRKSKLLPFRFYSAFQEILKFSYTSSYISNIEKHGYGDNSKFRDILNKTKNALNKALELSIPNISIPDGRNLILVDLSGSMDSPISSKSTIRNRDISALFGAVLHSKLGDRKTSIWGFGETAKEIYLDEMNKLSLLDKAKAIETLNVGHATNAHLPVQNVTQQNRYFDRIFIFTDEQVYDSRYPSYNRSRGVLRNAILKYREELNPQAQLYIFNLAGYSTGSIMPEDDGFTHLIAGWSDAIFKFIEVNERSHEAILKSIYENTDYENYTIS